MPMIFRLISSSVMIFLIISTFISCNNGIKPAFGTNYSKKDLQNLTNEAYFSFVRKDFKEGERKVYLSPDMTFRTDMCFHVIYNSCFGSLQHEELPDKVPTDTLKVVIPENLKGHYSLISGDVDVRYDSAKYIYISPLIKSKVKNQYLIVGYSIQSVIDSSMELRIMNRAILRYEKRKKHFYRLEPIDFNDEIYLFVEDVGWRSRMKSK